jgi:hypothetical protein
MAQLTTIRIVILFAKSNKLIDFLTVFVTFVTIVPFFTPNAINKASCSSNK